MEKRGKLLKPWHMGTHLRVLSESYPMTTDMAGFRWFSKNSVSLLEFEGLTILCQQIMLAVQ